MKCFNYIRQPQTVVMLALMLVTACASGDELLGAGVEIDAMSKTTRPGEDFHHFANEGWFGTTQMPPGRDSLSVMNSVAEDINGLSEKLIHDAVRKAESGAANPAEARLAALYQSYVDMDARNRLGTSPIQESLNVALALETKEEAAAFMARPDSHSITHLGSFLDPDDPGNIVLWLDRDGGPGLLGLPDKDLYSSDDDRSHSVLSAYRDYIEGTFHRAGVAEAGTRADALIRLEARLAEGVWSQEQLRDRSANNHAITPAELESFAPGFPWRAFLQAGSVADVTTLNLAQDTAVQHAATVFSDTPLEDWKSYLAFHHIDDYWASLSNDFDEAGYEFKYRTVHGIDSRADIEARAVSFVSTSLRDDVGRLFVDARFSAESRDQVALITDYIRQAMAEKFHQAAWMDQETRSSALRKLDQLSVEVGYPRSPDTYADVEVFADDLAGNRRRLRERDLRKSLGRIGEPYPEGTWFMGAHVVDAAYSPQRNLIIFPAGMLQPPIFKAGIDPAANFGTIGLVMAHEIGHAFDDQGSQFDADGRFAPWWTDRARDEYQARTDEMVNQYCDYEVLPKVFLECEQMRGEIIADMSGLEIAYRAYEMYVQEHQDGRAPVIDGLSGPERFFLAREQLARTVTTDAWLERAARQSNHPPGKARSIIPLQNFTPWYHTFGVEEGDPLFKPSAHRITLWGE